MTAGGKKGVRGWKNSFLTDRPCEGNPKVYAEREQPHAQTRKEVREAAAGTFQGFLQSCAHELLHGCLCLVALLHTNRGTDEAAEDIFYTLKVKLRLS